MQVQNSILWLHVGGTKEKALQLFAISVNDSDICSDDLGIVNGSDLRTIGIASRFDLERPDDIFPGLFVDVHMVYYRII